MIPIRLRAFRVSSLLSSLVLLAGLAAAQATISNVRDFNVRPWAESKIVEKYYDLVQVAMGPRGDLHVVYVGRDIGDPVNLCPSTNLFYAWQDPLTGGWEREPVYSGAVGGASIRVDAFGMPHISFNTNNAFSTWGQLMYAVKVAGTWVIEVVDPQSVYGYSTSIAVNSLGEPGILAKKEQDLELVYWYKLNGVWVMEFVDNDSNPGRYQVLRFDKNGVAHAAYSTWSPKTDCRYAVRLGANNWSVVTVNSSVNCYRGVGFDLDSKGNPHIAYHDDDCLLFYSHFDGANWITSSVPNIEGGKYASLRIGHDDLPQIAVREHSACGGTDFIFWTRLNAGGFWSYPEKVRDVPGGYLSAGGNSLVIDAFNRPIVALDTDQLCAWSELIVCAR